MEVDTKNIRIQPGKLAIQPTVRWGAAVLARSLHRLEAAPAIDRTRQLRAAAYTFGGLMDGMGIEVTSATTALLQAAHIDPHDEAAVLLIHRSLSRGRLAPLTMKDRRA